MNAEAKRTLKRVDKLLKSPDLAQIAQGAELAAALGEPALIREILRGCAMDLHGNLLFNKLFTDRTKKTRWGPEVDPARQGALTCAALVLLAEAPDAVARADGPIRRLRIDRLRIPEFPEEIGRFTALEALTLPYNSVASLPETLGALGALRELDLTGNRLQSLPGGLFDLPLEALLLGGNGLEVLDPRIQQLASLRALDLSANRLSALPALPAGLVALDLRDNELDALPAAALALPSLERLDLRKNPLQRLPEQIGALGGLRALWLDDAQREATPELASWLPGVTIWTESGRPPH